MKHKLSENANKLWRTRATLYYLLSVFICGGVYVFTYKIALIMLAVFTAVYMFVVFVAVPYVYHVTELLVKQDGIVITKGVIFRRRMSLMASKIQYVELLQSPLQRYFKVYTVAFRTAGTTVFVGQVDADLCHTFRAFKE